MTIDEAIESLSLYLHSDCYLDAPPNEAVELAIKALRAQQEAEKNEPFTLDELTKWYTSPEKGPIWVKFLDNGYVTPAILDCYEFTGELVAVWNGENAGLELYDRNYGKTWIAYRHKPKGDTHDD